MTKHCIKQKKGSKYCIACVAAMATGTSIEDFKTVVKRKRGPYTDFHLYWYLLHKGYTLGIGLNYEEESSDLHDNVDLCLEFNIRHFPAYVIVPSEIHPEKTHAVYWDGRWIRDPNPDKPDKCDVAHYRVLKWFPIAKMESEGGRKPEPNSTGDRKTVP